MTNREDDTPTTEADNVNDSATAASSGCEIINVMPTKFQASARDANFVRAGCVCTEIDITAG